MSDHHDADHDRDPRDDAPAAEADSQHSNPTGCDGCREGACCGEGLGQVHDLPATQNLPAASDEPDQGPAREKPRGRRIEPALVVRYAAMGQVGLFRHDLEQRAMPGSKMVIRSERGVELGEVLAIISDEPAYGNISPERLDEFIKANGSHYPLTRGGKVLRPANNQDLIEQRHLDASAIDEGRFCREQIRQMKLPMRLVTVEHLLGGERIIFYFASETRVDFRELVRLMASQYRTRIEMRQVGARDEARLVGDYERCGQRCCCQQYLKDLRPVSMRMAKTQKATLDPSKISGRCGRLMCCLRYEDEGYEALKKRLPRRNTWVRTEEVVGRVVETQIITQLVKLWLPTGVLAVVGNDEIIERDVEAPPIPQPGQSRRPAPKPRSERRMLRDEMAEKAAESDAQPAEAVEAPGDDEASDQDQRPKRRRRRRKKPASGKGQQASGQPSGEGGSAQNASQGQGQGEGGRSKRRRRRKKPSSSSRGGESNQSGQQGSGS
jgi:cell fate regulator YaaT (PSP1 superfamily)